MRNQALRKKVSLALSALASMLMFAPGAVFAFTAPTDDTALGYAIYDTVVNGILGGPIGFVGGIAIIIWGGVQLFRNWMPAVLAIIAGTAVSQADTIVGTLGMSIALI